VIYNYVKSNSMPMEWAECEDKDPLFFVLGTFLIYCSVCHLFDIRMLSCSVKVENNSCLLGCMKLYVVV
jgi:hypothetical protein